MDHEEVHEGKFWCYFCSAHHCRACMLKEKKELETFLPMNLSVDQLINSVFMDTKPSPAELEQNEFYFCCQASIEYTSKNFKYY